MKFKYTTKQGIFNTDDIDKIPLDELLSINDEPSFENLLNGYKAWHFEGNWHRESGPARIYSDQTYEFYLNGFYYKNINDWLIDNPNKEIEFQAMMRLKYF